MSIRNATAASALAMIFAASPVAFAADLGGKGDPTSSDYVAPVSWTGIYLGGRFGYNFGNLDVGFDEFNSHPSVNGFEDVGEINGLSMTGLTGGVEGGLDKQFGRVLIGVSGAYDWSNSEWSASGIEINPDGSNDTLLDNDESFKLTKDNEWSVYGRLGYLLLPRLLVYGKLGYGQAEFTASGSDMDSNTETVDVWSFGGGTEYAIDRNVFAGIEVLHARIDAEDLSNECGDTCSGGNDRVTGELSETRIMGTLKVKLNGGDIGLGF